MGPDKVSPGFLIAKSPEYIGCKLVRCHFTCSVGSFRNPLGISLIEHLAHIRRSPAFRNIPEGMNILFRQGFRFFSHQPDKQGGTLKAVDPAFQIKAIAGSEKKAHPVQPDGIGIVDCFVCCKGGRNGSGQQGKGQQECRSLSEQGFSDIIHIEHGNSPLNRL